MAENELSDSINENKTVEILLPEKWDDVKFIYDKILQVRDIDNQLMWTRISLMLVIQGIFISFLINAYAILYASHFLILLFSLFLGLYLSFVFCFRSLLFEPLNEKTLIQF